MADDDLLPPAAPPEAPVSRRGLQCEYCGCTLVRESGEVLRMSTRAKGLRDLEHRIETMTADLTEARRLLTVANEEIEEFKRRVAAAAGGERPARGGIFSGS
jgi:hypothetical protein